MNEFVEHVVTEHHLYRVTKDFVLNSIHFQVGVTRIWTDAERLRFIELLKPLCDADNSPNDFFMHHFEWVATLENKYKPRREWVAFHVDNVVTLFKFGGGSPFLYIQQGPFKYVYSHTSQTANYIRHNYKILLNK